MTSVAVRNAADPDLPELSQFTGIPVAVISDVMDGLGMPTSVVSGVRRLAGGPIVGRARTVWRMTAPSNAMQADIAAELGMGTQKVIDTGRPSDIVVIAAGGDLDSSVWGGNMGTRASQVGILGILSDGAVRDIEEQDGLGISVYARAAIPRQAYKRLVTLSIDLPIVCGNVWVRPDDIIAADADGVVVIPPARAQEIAAKASAVMEAEGIMQKYIRSGNTLVSAVEKFKIR